MANIDSQPATKIEILELQELPLTVLPADQVRLQIKALQCDDADKKAEYNITETLLSTQHSTQYRAVICAIGRDVQGFKLRDCVRLLPPVALRRNGRYAEYLQIQPERLICHS